MDDSLTRSLLVSRIFTPTAPVDERSLFAGRRDQLKKVIDAVNQKGQHAVIYGERGVGKTSLANVLAAFLPAVGARNVITPRVNCDSSDTFQSVFDKAFREVGLIRQTQGMGFGASKQNAPMAATELLGGDFSPDNVRRALGTLSKWFVPVIVFDEFDRLKDDVKHSVADTIKSLSDHAVDATIVVVGVADTVVDLIKEHASVERAMVQVHMPRMSDTEVSEVIQTGAGRLELSVTQQALKAICLLAQGLPHYAHLIGLYSARTIVESGGSEIDIDAVTSAIDEAVNNSQHSIQHMYHVATMSPRKDNLFSDVLLACALAHTDQLGYFAAQDVRDPMREITGKSYDIPSFSQHLNEFTEEKRGPILKKIGTARRYRFRFLNPLMQPFIVMQGCKDGKIVLQ
jgi:Cdc6-like AAA superfamily ATPase